MIAFQNYPDTSSFASTNLRLVLRDQRFNFYSSVGLPDKEMTAMELGLAHSLSRYKLKFSPDKIDTMIVQVRFQVYMKLVKLHAFNNVS